MQSPGPRAEEEVWARLQFEKTRTVAEKRLPVF